MAEGNIVEEDAATTSVAATDEPDSFSECTQSFQSLAISVGDNQELNMSMREALSLAALLRLLMETPDEETKCMAGRVLFHLACLCL